MDRLLEVCVDSLASARAAIAGGADRLELCSALGMGGLTPYTALLQQIRRESGISIRCLMRPRAGDFLYTHDQIEQMAMQIQELKAAGANGFVIGCLTPEGNLDQEAMKPLIAAADGSGLTLHRCIDVSRNLEEVYMDAMALGLDTILTSGGAGNCQDGFEKIARMVKMRDQYNGPEVLIGAGVNAAVITNILRKLPHARAFHMSGKMELESGMRFRKQGVPMGIPGLDEWHIQQTSQATVEKAKAALTVE